MMYQFDISVGASPDLATVNEAPWVESYVGTPLAEKPLEVPFVRSKLSDLPRAGSAGQASDICQQKILGQSRGFHQHTLKRVTFCGSLSID